jgi:hypothetical protein
MLDVLLRDAVGGADPVPPAAVRKLLVAPT